jgi:hypothetical protein
VNKLVYKHYNIPISYIGQTFKGTTMSGVKATRLKDKIKNAPKRGTLVVKGSAGPVINQLIEDGRTVTGIDFSERASTAFEQHQNPKTEVLLLYNVGNEITVNYNVSRQVLKSILKYYQHTDTLVVIETEFTKTELRNNYDFTPVNYIVIETLEEDSWVN